MPGPRLDDFRGREFVQRYEAEDLPTQVTEADRLGSVVDDPLASAGAARRGWGEPVAFPDRMLLVFGPYVALAPGEYEVRFRLSKAAANPSGITLDVCVDQGNRVLASLEVPSDSSTLADVDEAGYRTIALRFEVDTPLKNAEFRVFYSGGPDLRVDYVETVRRMKEGL